MNATSLSLYRFPDLSLCPSLYVHYTALAGSWMGGFLWQSAPPLLAGTGPGACYWLGVWKGTREVVKEEGRDGMKERAWEEGDRRDGGVVLCW